jgi:phage gpG-like protein
MKSKTQDIDLGFESILQDLETLSLTNVDVGYFDDGTMSDDGEMEMLDLASLQLNGSTDYDRSRGVHIPKRNFMDKTAVDYQEDLANLQQNLVGNLIDKKVFAIQGSIAVGEVYADFMKASIDAFDKPPNVDWWADAKGENNPLVDSGKMRDSIKVEVTVDRLESDY